jgi:phage terminase large subunit-like protein
MSRETNPTLPECGFVLDGIECHEVGDHFCVPRADHCQKFIEELCLHTKGQFFRKRFILADWQRDEIVRPLFGEVEWSVEFQAYKRRYEIAWIEVARKNGKTELLAALMLYLLVADSEESAEIYGVAKNREQASLCFDVAAQMVNLQPVLSKRLKIIKHKKRIYDAKTNSFYQVIAADAGGALGSNPHGVGADEICAWHDGGMWDSMRTGMGSGARRQPMMIAATTAGTDTESFAGKMHREMLANWERADDDPEKLHHIFAFIRNTSMDADPWDESQWYHASPALGDYLSIEAFRKQAAEAKANPLLENGFRVLKLNQWTTQAVRWMPMHLYDEAAGPTYSTAREAREVFTGCDCWFGLDLAARQDLTAMAYLFPADDGSVDLLYRFWCCEAALAKLDKLNGGRFLREFVEGGWLTVTDGDVLDFQKVYDDIEADSMRFNLLGGDADKWSSDPVLQEIQNRIYVPDDIFAYQNDYNHMSDSMHRILEMVIEKKFRTHGNPLARFCFEGAEARIASYNPDLVKPDKPDRNTASKRIDAVPASIMAVNAWWTRGGIGEMSVYATREPMVVGLEG